VGVITNIGLSHLELLGSPEALALAKAELLDEMPPSSRAILPKHDPYFSLLREHAHGVVMTVGEAADCDIWISKVLLNEDGCARFTLHAGGQSISVRLSAPGRHQVKNALAAAAASFAVGASLSEIQAGLAAYLPEPGRMRVLHTPGGFTVVDDSYNANPAAVRATLEFLAETPAHGRKIAILGDMRELGPNEGALHRDIGRFAMELGIDALLGVGELGKEYVNGAADSRAQAYPDNAAVVQAARTLLQAGDLVLIKGSRVMKMEEIVTALAGEE
jgi:UDP-N-acetylmuramoyl-tripeptide--D-alanyl-D-alanine ligase